MTEWMSLFLLYPCRPAGWLRFQFSNGVIDSSALQPASFLLSAAKIGMTLLAAAGRENKSEEAACQSAWTLRQQQFYQHRPQVLQQNWRSEDCRRGLRLLEEMHFLRSWMTLNKVLPKCKRLSSFTANELQFDATTLILTGQNIWFVRVVCGRQSCPFTISVGNYSFFLKRPPFYKCFFTRSISEVL